MVAAEMAKTESNTSGPPPGHDPLASNPPADYNPYAEGSQNPAVNHDDRPSQKKRSALDRAPQVAQGTNVQYEAPAGHSAPSTVTGHGTLSEESEAHFLLSTSQGGPFRDSILDDDDDDGFYRDDEDDMDLADDFLDSDMPQVPASAARKGKAVVRPANQQQILRAPNPNYSAPTSGWGQSSAVPGVRFPPMCVICKQKPVYSRNGKTYVTCGLTCGAQLDQQNKAKAYKAVRPQPPRLPDLCEVCKTQPKAVNSAGKRFPTCGYKCAAKLTELPPPAAPRSTAATRAPSAPRVSMMAPPPPPAPLPPPPSSLCTVCKKRPKRMAGPMSMKTYDQCSVKCEEKAKAALASAVAGTCSSCLACWRGNIRGPEQFYCSDACQAAVQANAPTLIEVPRGHIHFTKRNQDFQNGWDNTAQPKGTIMHMYSIIPTEPVIRRYQEHRRTLTKSPTESTRWVAVDRECNVGDSGSVKLCASPACELCTILRHSFAPHGHPNGISANATSAKCDEAFVNTPQGPTKVMLSVKVAHGKLKSLTLQQLLGPLRNGIGIASVATIRMGKTVDTGDLQVYQTEAVLPVGLMVYS